MAQDIYIKFKGDASALLSTINRVESSLKGLDSQARKATGALDSVERGTRGISGAAATAMTAMRGFIGALGVRELLQFGDAVQNIQNRMRLINPALGSAEQSFQRVLEIANRTQQPLEATADLYQKVARSAEQYGMTAGQVGTVTETLANVLRLAGADAGTASAAIMQFGQALGAGALRGDELNSLIEATSGEILPILAAELGVSAGEVRKLGSEGKITGDVLINALGNASDDVTARVGNMSVTIGGALTIFKNNLLALGTQAAPVFNAIAQGILLVANNLTRIASYAAAGVAVWGGYTAAITAARVATLLFNGGLVAMRGALIRTGIGALVVALGEIIYRFTTLTERVGGFANALGFLRAYATEVWERIRIGMSLLGEEAWYVGQAIKNAFAEAIAWVVRKFADFTQSIIDGYNAVLEVFGMDPVQGRGLGTGLADALEEDLKQSQETLGWYRESLNTSWGLLFDPMETTVEKYMRDQGIEIITEDVEDLATETWQAVDPMNAMSAATSKMTEEIAKLEAEFRKVPDALDIVKGGIDAFNRLNPLEGLSKTYQTELAGLQYLRNRDLINEEEYLRTKAELHSQYAQKIAETQRQAAVESLRNAGVTNSGILTIYDQTMASMQQAQQGGLAGMIGFTDAMSTVFNQLGQQNRKAFEAAKAFNIASAIMNTALAATKAFAQGGILGFVTAAAVIAAGMAQVAAIRAQTYSGRALGGPVMGGETYMVGENGPELFTPATSGSITRNDQLGSDPVTVNFTINAIDSRGIDEVLIQRKGVIQQIISDAMLEKGQRSRM